MIMNISSLVKYRPNKKTKQRTLLYHIIVFCSEEFCTNYNCRYMYLQCSMTRTIQLRFTWFIH